MNAIITEILPQAIGVAISPMPIMIVLIMIIARNVRGAIGYVVGWLLGILLVGVVLVRLSDVALKRGDSVQSQGIAVAVILLGVIFLILAYLASRGIPRKKKTIVDAAEAATSTDVPVAASTAGDMAIVNTESVLEQTATSLVTGVSNQYPTATAGDAARALTLATTAPMQVEDKKPGWMRAVDKIPAWIAFLVALLSAFNPKNLSMILVAVTDIHDAGIPLWHAGLAFLNFALLATVTIAAPLIHWWYKGDAADEQLRNVEKWLAANQAYIMTGLFLVLGVMAIIKGWQRLPG